MRGWKEGGWCSGVRGWKEGGWCSGVRGWEEWQCVLCCVW